MKKATFYHAGCLVCQAAEHELVDGLDRSKYEVEMVNLGERKDRIDEAMLAGVRSLPALVIDGQPFHINYGASLDEIKGVRQTVPVDTELEDEVERWDPSCCD